MIDKEKIIDTVVKKLKKLPKGHYLDLRTYKRNRSVVIVKVASDALMIVENGYGIDRFQVNTESLKKHLKILLKKEFPRSRKIRLYDMGRFPEDEAMNTRRKTL